jgi:hypothetical protein
VIKDRKKENLESNLIIEENNEDLIYNKLPEYDLKNHSK